MRRIAVAVGGRANLGSLLSVIERLAVRPEVELFIIRYGAACSRWYGAPLKELDRFNCIDIPCLVDSESPQAMVLHSSLIMSTVGQALERLHPDVVLVCGDRYCVLPVAYAAALQNRVVAHTMGGETTGSIDESVRWAITSLAHWHFPATHRSYRRLTFNQQHVWNFGCPRIDLAASVKPDPVYKDAIVVLQHGVTTETADTVPWLSRITKKYAGKRRLVWIWGNSDYGSPQIAEAARSQLSGWETHRNLSPEAFMALLASCAVLVGNSSSGVREGAYLGTPVVQVGTRQRGRESAENVRYARTTVEVVRAIGYQLKRGRYESDRLYGDGTAGAKIAGILAREPLPSVQK